MLQVEHLGLADYHYVWQRMQQHIALQQPKDCDQLWLLQHPPVYTQGVAGKAEHLLNPNSIPVIQSDRGGQITYHGPGQLVCYPLLNLKRLKLGPKKLIHHLEQIVIELLRLYGVTGKRREGAPGIYVNDSKIASIGLRVRRGYCYHGTAININMDLSPFNNINPCGYRGLQVTQLSDLIPTVDFNTVSEQYIQLFLQQFNTPLVNKVFEEPVL